MELGGKEDKWDEEARCEGGPRMRPAGMCAGQKRVMCEGGKGQQ